MADALDAAHRIGIIHRDFKPANVILVPGTRDARPVVTDFRADRSIRCVDRMTLNERSI